MTVCEPFLLVNEFITVCINDSLYKLLNAPHLQFNIS